MLVAQVFSPVSEVVTIAISRVLGFSTTSYDLVRAWPAAAKMEPFYWKYEEAADGRAA